MSEKFNIAIYNCIRGNANIFQTHSIEKLSRWMATANSAFFFFVLLIFEIICTLVGCSTTYFIADIFR